MAGSSIMLFVRVADTVTSIELPIDATVGDLFKEIERFFSYEIRTIHMGNIFMRFKENEILLSDFAISNEMFIECSKNYKVKDREELQNMIGNVEEIKESIGYPNEWDVSNVTDMSKIFYKNDTFNYPIGDWDVSNVTDMSGMFYAAETFNQPIGDWDVSNVTIMSEMFSGADSFNQPIGSWVVSNVTDMSKMFYSATSFNQPLGDWDVSNVTNADFMF